MRLNTLWAKTELVSIKASSTHSYQQTYKACNLNITTKYEGFLEYVMAIQLIKKSTGFTDREDPSPCSQDPTKGHKFEPVQTSS
jgi:hypothetical protein